ncbi:uncharacterized protein zgc:123010 isoform X4 [Hemiscyllium ocellatum]|uniref:uncharacterized protein zgc:123010 isoform X4 n=1 Tax=Hemiscyllium ocellatum TaxID=170820 RepID=UPI002965F57B|nr:uncharacterized protein zgc:123010 isoform X4 [Hemiscyllium ocellatum]
MPGDMQSVRELYRLLGFPSDNFEKLEENAMECGEGMNGEGNPIKLSSIQDNGIKLDKHITDQERAKKKAERRRAKKKRQKERRKQEKGRSNEENKLEKEDSDSNEEIETIIKIQNIPGGGVESSEPLGVFENGDSCTLPGPVMMDEEPEWDISSAFVANAASHIRPKSKGKSDKKSKENKENETKSHELSDLDPLILKSRQLAEQGIDLVKQGYYSEAVELFTEAVQFDPKDHRYFGNRSYCYDRLRKYNLALEDAETSIRLAADWPKGYFRKGRALVGIKRYAEAESAFELVLQLDKDCDDAVKELFKVRMFRLMNMGFTQQQSLMALQQYQTVEAALDSHLELNFQRPDSGTLEIPEEEDCLYLIDCPVNGDQTELTCASLWVGNVTVHVKEKQLKDLFRKWWCAASFKHCSPWGTETPTVLLGREFQDLCPVTVKERRRSSKSRCCGAEPADAVYVLSLSFQGVEVPVWKESLVSCCSAGRNSAHHWSREWMSHCVKGVI